MRWQSAYHFLLGLFLVFVSVVTVRADISGHDLLTDKKISVKSGKKGAVAVFMSSKCPCSNSHVAIVKKLSADFKDFSFVVIHSNVDEPLELAKPYFKAAGFPFSVIRDEDGKLADEFKALKTPHAFLIAPDGEILYKGGVTSSSNGETADKHYLRDALADVDAGRKVKVPYGRTLGCAISRGKKHVW